MQRKVLLDEFEEILWMPTKYLMQRQKYDSNLRMKLANKYKSLPNYECCDLANEWRAAFNALTPEQREIAKLIIAKGVFGKQNYNCEDQAILDVLKHYDWRG